MKFGCILAGCIFSANSNTLTDFSSVTDQTRTLGQTWAWGVWGGYIPPQGPPYLQPKLVGGGVWQFFPRGKNFRRNRRPFFFFLLATGELFGSWGGGVYTPPAGGRYPPPPPQRKKRAHVCSGRIWVDLKSRKKRAERFFTNRLGVQRTLHVNPILFFSYYYYYSHSYSLIIFTFVLHVSVYPVVVFTLQHAQFVNCADHCFESEVKRHNNNKGLRINFTIRPRHGVQRTQGIKNKFYYTPRHIQLDFWSPQCHRYYTFPVDVNLDMNLNCTNIGEYIPKWNRNSSNSWTGTGTHKIVQCRRVARGRGAPGGTCPHLQKKCPPPLKSRDWLQKSTLKSKNVIKTCSDFTIYVIFLEKFRLRRGQGRLSASLHPQPICSCASRTRGRRFTSAPSRKKFNAIKKLLLCNPTWQPYSHHLKTKNIWCALWEEKCPPCLRFLLRAWFSGIETGS